MHGRLPFLSKETRRHRVRRYDCEKTRRPESTAGIAGRGGSETKTRDIFNERTALRCEVSF